MFAVNPVRVPWVAGAIVALTSPDGNSPSMSAAAAPAHSPRDSQIWTYLKGLSDAAADVGSIRARWNLNRRRRATASACYGSGA